MAGSVAGSGDGRVRDAAALARALFGAIGERDEPAVARLIHPDAQLEMAMARGRLIRGREETIEALRQGWARVHSLWITRLHVLSDGAVIIEGRSCYRTEQGFADWRVVWLCEYRDGMLIRQRLFDTVAEARAVWEVGTSDEPAEPGRADTLPGR